MIRKRIRGNERTALPPSPPSPAKFHAILSIVFLLINFSVNFIISFWMPSNVNDIHTHATATNAVDERISGVTCAEKDSHKVHIWSGTRNREFVWKAIYNYWCSFNEIWNAVKNKTKRINTLIIYGLKQGGVDVWTKCVAHTHTHTQKPKINQSSQIWTDLI